MKPFIPSLFGAAALLSGCAQSVSIAHKQGVNFETEIKADLSAPVNMNFGYQSRSLVVVPPRQSRPLPALFNPKNIQDGELLSTYSVFKIERDTMTQTDASGKTVSFTEPGAFTIRTGGATGAAAKNIAKQQEGGGVVLESLPGRSGGSPIDRMHSILND